MNQVTEVSVLHTNRFRLQSSPSVWTNHFLLKINPVVQHHVPYRHTAPCKSHEHIISKVGLPKCIRVALAVIGIDIVYIVMYTSLFTIIQTLRLGLNTIKIMTHLFPFYLSINAINSCLVRNKPTSNKTTYLEYRSRQVCKPLKHKSRQFNIV